MVRLAQNFMMPRHATQRGSVVSDHPPGCSWRMKPEKWGPPEIFHRACVAGSPPKKNRPVGVQLVLLVVVGVVIRLVLSGRNDRTLVGIDLDIEDLGAADDLYLIHPAVP